MTIGTAADVATAKNTGLNILPGHDTDEVLWMEHQVINLLQGAQNAFLSRFETTMSSNATLESAFCQAIHQAYLAVGTVCIAQPQPYQPDVLQEGLIQFNTWLTGLKSCSVRTLLDSSVFQQVIRNLVQASETLDQLLETYPNLMTAHQWMNAMDGCVATLQAASEKALLSPGNC